MLAHPHPYQAICSLKRAQQHLLPRAETVHVQGEALAQGGEPRGGAGAHPENLPADVGNTVLFQGIPFCVLYQIRHGASTTELHHQLQDHRCTRRKSISQARPPFPASPLKEDQRPWGQNWYKLKNRCCEAAHKSHRD